MKMFHGAGWAVAGVLALCGIVAAQNSNLQSQQETQNDPALRQHSASSMLAAFRPVSGQENTYALTSEDGSKAIVFKAQNDSAGVWVVDNKTKQQVALAAIEEGVALLSSHDNEWQPIAKSEQFRSQQLNPQQLTIHLDKQQDSGFATPNPNQNDSPRIRTQPRQKND